MLCSYTTRGLPVCAYKLWYTTPANSETFQLFLRGALVLQSGCFVDGQHPGNKQITKIFWQQGSGPSMLIVEQRKTGGKHFLPNANFTM
eukprot:1159720-Pelagomonas_calceolata.AAC.10